MKYRNYYIASIVSIFLLIFLDQITKHLAVIKLKGKAPYKLIPGVLQFEYVTNEGAAWGLMAGKQTMFLIVTLIILAALIYIYIKTPKNKHYAIFRFTLVLLFSGAVGNLIDRIINNYVHDFIYFVLIDFPIFNVADCYVTISAFLLIILLLFVYRAEDDFDFISFKKKKHK